MIILEENVISAYDHFLKVESSLWNAIDRVLKSGSIKKRNKTVRLTPLLRKFLKHLQASDNLEKLITLPPTDFKKYLLALRPTYKSFFSKRWNADKRILSNIFVDHGYSAFTKIEFIRAMAIDCCPYCNRNYIYSIDKHVMGELKTVKPQIDHFYPQTRFPWFGSSFYNLIPSCQTCNGIDGGKNNESPLDHKLVNPYLIKDGDFLFSYYVKNISLLNPLKDKNSVVVKLKAPKGNNEIFGLKQFYELHADHVLELVMKSKMKYSKTYRAYLRKHKKFKFSDSEIDRMILGNYTLPKETHKRPLAKLYQDIGRELGLI